MALSSHQGEENSSSNIDDPAAKLSIINNNIAEKLIMEIVDEKFSVSKVPSL